MFLESKHVAIVPAADRAIRVNILNKDELNKRHMKLGWQHDCSLHVPFGFVHGHITQYQETGKELIA